MNITKMKNRNKKGVLQCGTILLLLAVVLSAGCIKYLPIGNAGANGTHPESPDSVAIDIPATSGTVSSGNSSVVPSAVAATPSEKLEVVEVDPELYITPDPYRLPYRDHGNWTTVDASRIPKTPEFTKHIILRSNSTAFSVNVTKGPLVIDLTFSPQFTNPDMTSLEGTNSFVSSNAEVTVINSMTNVTVATEGYNWVYSTEDHKKITVYSDGSYIITLTGNFIDVTMAIITGSAQEPTPAATAEYNNQGDTYFE
jgi:hypothetical protein